MVHPLEGIKVLDFSIAVAAYLLIRMEKRLDELAIAINNLEKGVAKYFGKV